MPNSALFLLGAFVSVSPGASAAPQSQPRITMDATAAPDLRVWSERARRLCEIWYPVITDLLPGTGDLSAVKIVLEPELEVPAYAMPGRSEIHISAAFVRGMVERGQDDFGMVIHELTHLVQRYPRSVPWLTEGIADYIRYERFEPTARRKTVDLDRARYDAGYWVSSGFLAWMETTFDPALIKKLHRALSAGSYQEETFFPQATGRDLPTLWKAFVAERKKQPASPAPPPVATAPAAPALAEMLAAAEKAGRPPVVQLTAEWCDLCRQLEATFRRRESTQAVGAVHLVRYDVNEEPGRSLVARFGVRALPTLVALDGQGNEVDRYVPPAPAAEERPDPIGWLKVLPLMGTASLQECVAGAEKNPTNTAWQLIAGRRLSKAGRALEARPFLERAAGGGNPLVARQGLWSLAEQDLAAGDLPRVRLHAERLLDRDPTTPEALKAFRFLATSAHPPRAVLTAAVSRRLEMPGQTAGELTDLLLHAVRAGAGEAAGDAAARLEASASTDPRRFWFMAEAAHLQGWPARALDFAEKARAFGDSRLRRLIDEDLARYRRRSSRPSRLVAALGAAGADHWPQPWPAALSRVRAESSRQVDLRFGLLGHWKLDRPGGPMVIDRSGLGHSATLVGFSAEPSEGSAPPAKLRAEQARRLRTRFGDSDTQAGRRGPALALDPARRTMVTVNDSPTLNPRDELTIAAWIKPKEWNGNRRIVQKGLTDNQFRLTAEREKLIFEVVTDRGGTGPQRVAASAPLPAVDAWVHLAGVYDGSRLRLLANGAEIATAPAEGQLLTSRDPLVIGCKRPGETLAMNCFSGLIEEVVLYDRALTDQELRRLARPTSTRSFQLSQGVTGPTTRGR